MAYKPPFKIKIGKGAGSDPAPELPKLFVPVPLLDQESSSLSYTAGPEAWNTENFSSAYPFDPIAKPFNNYSVQGAIADIFGVEVAKMIDEEFMKDLVKKPSYMSMGAEVTPNQNTPTIETLKEAIAKVPKSSMPDTITGPDDPITGTPHVIAKIEPPNPEDGYFPARAQEEHPEMFAELTKAVSSKSTLTVNIDASGVTKALKALKQKIADAMSKGD